MARSKNKPQKDKKKSTLEELKKKGISFDEHDQISGGFVEYFPDPMNPKQDDDHKDDD